MNYKLIAVQVGDALKYDSTVDDSIDPSSVGMIEALPPASEGREATIRRRRPSPAIFWISPKLRGEVVSWHGGLQS